VDLIDPMDPPDADVVHDVYVTNGGVVAHVWDPVVMGSMPGVLVFKEKDRDWDFTVTGTRPFV
jgi:hypothetical protein